MNKVKNILFIMADQLRFDYLSCYGHPHLKTPHIDGLAKKGILFEFLNRQPLRMFPFSSSDEFAQLSQGFSPAYPSLFSHSLYESFFLDHS